MRLVAAIPAVAALLVGSLAWAGDHDYDHHRVINQASELVPWCRSETESRYIARNITPYQWTASYHERSNVLYVDGKLRVHDEDVAVRCRIARGARESYAVIEIDDATL